MKRHLSNNVPESSDSSEYSQSIKLSESILYEGLVVIGCTTLIVIVSMIALSASFPHGKKDVHAAKKPTGQMQLSVNSTTTRYVVQSAYLEVKP